MGRHIATMIEGDIANLRAARLTAEQEDAGPPDSTA